VGAKGFAAILFVFFLVNSASVCAAELKWDRYASFDGQFSVMMPGPPEFRTGVNNTPIGNIGSNIHEYETGTIDLTVQYSDLPKLAIFFGGRRSIYRKSRKAFLEDVQGERISYDKFWLDGYFGRELSFETLTRFGKVRFLLTGRRLYVFQASVPKEISDRSLIDYYLDSFRQMYKKPKRRRPVRH